MVVSVADPTDPIPQPPLVAAAAAGSWTRADACLASSALPNEPNTVTLAVDTWETAAYLQTILRLPQLPTATNGGSAAPSFHDDGHDGDGTGPPRTVWRAAYRMVTRYNAADLHVVLAVGGTVLADAAHAAHMAAAAAPRSAPRPADAPPSAVILAGAPRALVQAMGLPASTAASSDMDADASDSGEMDGAAADSSQTAAMGGETDVALERHARWVVVMPDAWPTAPACASRDDEALEGADDPTQALYAFTARRGIGLLSLEEEWHDHVDAAPAPPAGANAAERRAAVYRDAGRMVLDSLQCVAWSRRRWTAPAELPRPGAASDASQRRSPPSPRAAGSPAADAPHASRIVHGHEGAKAKQEPNTAGEPDDGDLTPLLTSIRALRERNRAAWVASATANDAEHAETAQARRRRIDAAEQALQSLFGAIEAPSDLGSDDDDEASLPSDSQNGDAAHAP
ncbi:hypothetical protein CXG81DRAFT_23714 [Caulochytrium protostelioides]|uniref:Uncharacterized protein n=1 Tax=Caulochytrium protostelioides TaxID=1555241 RepID=A0A4P9XDQ9_9FUNG|nr:hypothetical protein CXG81DRAFT_23714 [Caulochytrium protostelioides]|eukprot:RKP03602.1 hypothetical protein CXG81DRAFT_23714 [Caulochytrium protostelioides]